MKSRIGQKKEVNYANTLAKIQVTANFLMEDMRRNLLPKFIEIWYEDAILVPIWLSTNMAAGNDHKQLSLTLSFATKE